MHALPNLTVQLRLVRRIGLDQVARGNPGAVGGGIELSEGPRVRHMDERRRIRTSSERAPQRRGRGVVLAEWREAEDLFDGAQDGGRRVERAADPVAAGG